MRRRKLINTHNTKQKYRFRQHQETPKITDRVQYSIEKYKSTIFSRDLSKKIEEDLKRYDKDHISCHENDRMDSWSVANFKLWASSIKGFLVHFFTRDKEASNSVWGKIRVKMAERFNVNTINKHKMLKNLFTKMSKSFNWEITRLIQFHDCLFIDPRISWWSDSYMHQSLTGLQLRKT